MRSNLTIHPFTTEISLSYHSFYVKQSYVNYIAQTDSEASDCGKSNRKEERNYRAETCSM